MDNVKDAEITFYSDEATDAEDTKLGALSQTIQQRMPKLEDLSVCFESRTDELAFVLKSESLKKSLLSENMLSDIELGCPLLETLNGSKL